MYRGAMDTTAADPVAAATLWRWGRALDAVVAARGLSPREVSMLVGLGDRLDAVDVATVLDGRGSLAGCWEVTIALGLGLDVSLIDGDALVAERRSSWGT